MSAYNNYMGYGYPYGIPYQQPIQPNYNMNNNGNIQPQVLQNQQPPVNQTSYLPLTFLLLSCE